MSAPTSEQQKKIDQLRFELRLFGFAAVKEIASILGRTSGEMECPLCQQTLRFSVSSVNGHMRAVCETENCINAME